MMLLNTQNECNWLDEADRGYLTRVVIDLLLQKQCLEIQLSNAEPVVKVKINQIVSAIEYRTTHFNTEYFKYMKNEDYDLDTLDLIQDMAINLIKMENASKPNR